MMYAVPVMRDSEFKWWIFPYCPSLLLLQSTLHTQAWANPKSPQKCFTADRIVPIIPQVANKALHILASLPLAFFLSSYPHPPHFHSPDTPNGLTSSQDPHCLASEVLHMLFPPHGSWLLVLTAQLLVSLGLSSLTIRLWARSLCCVFTW